MGCDIHIEVFARVRDQWTYVARPPAWMIKEPGSLWGFSHSDWPVGRSYQTFGVLAGMRGDIVPTIPPRGLPEFVEAPTWDEYIFERRTLDLGEHTHSYMTLTELASLPWDTLDYVPDVVSEFIPMLRKIERHGVSAGDIMVVFGFDS